MPISCMTSPSSGEPARVPACGSCSGSSASGTGTTRLYRNDPGVQGPLLVDSGTATYTMDPEARDRFPSTAMHNTDVVDGRPQAVPSGPFHWRTRTDAVCTLWEARPGRDRVVGGHLVGRYRVHVAAVEVGALAVRAGAVADEDHLVSPECSTPLNDMVSSQDKRLMRFHTGHVGLIASSYSQNNVLPKVGQWLKARSD